MTRIMFKTKDEELLESVAREALATHGAPARALAFFIEEITDAGGLCCALIDASTLEIHARAFLAKIAGGS